MPTPSKFQPASSVAHRKASLLSVPAPQNEHGIVAAVAYDFREDGSVAPLRMFEAFKNKASRAFANDESIAARVPRTAGVLGIVIARGERLHRGKSTDPHGGDGSFSAAANHHFRGSTLDNLEGVANGMSRSGARRGGGGIRSARAITNGNLSGRQIDNGGRDEKGRNLARAAVQQLAMLALDDVESTDAGRNVNAHFIEVRILRLPVGGLHGKIRPGQRNLNEARHLLEFFFFDPLEGVEVFHFSGDFAIESGGVEMCNGRNAAASGDEVPPAFLRADSQRAN